MAALPSPTQVAGDHSVIYEAYYNAVDPNGSGSVGGMEAARFLKKSGLSDVILSRIWDLSDPKSRGCLDKNGMFVALKLVALVQNGKDLSLKSINDDVPPPKLGDVPLPKPSKPPPPPAQKNQSQIITSMAPPPPPPPPAPSLIDWSIKPNEREKYDKLFDSLQPSNGLIAGNKVKNVLMESKLPFDTLGKIWDLADQDKDGMLNRHEFVVAMHLVYKALEKYTIPNELPIELKKPTLAAPPPSPLPPSNNLNLLTKTTNVVGNNNDGIIQMKQSCEGVAALPTATVKPTLPQQPTTTTTTTTTLTNKLTDWVVSDEEKAKSDVLFLKSDIDKDGFVSGQEIKDVFLQSGVPQPVLAHIWALCDIKQMGKLNNEQFALAMWLVARCLKGIEPPPALTPEMVPPSFRIIKQQQQQLPIDGLVENNNTRYSNPELDMITKDIEDLAREKLLLETDIAQKEADIKIKSGEIKSLQSELDTLAATLKQLENQKGEAQKRLNDLKLQVDKLRVQAAEQADLVKAQETELNVKKEQLEGLKNEEEKLEKLKEENVQKIDNLNKNLQNTQLNISQSKALITQLQEQTRQMKDAIKSCDVAIESGDLTQLPDAVLRIKPEFKDVEFNKFHNVINNGHSNIKMNGHDDDPFGGGRESESANFATSTFNDDPFKEDPFNNKNDPFNSAFPPHSTTSTTNDAFASDPFGNNNNNNNDNSRTRDPFEDTFNKPTTDQEDNKDAFGCDPFAILHAPTREGGGGGAPPRPTSPTPALPPKKSKQPPPRPAPPRPAPPPAKKSSESFDPFGSAVAGEFADFSNFDAKFEEVDNKISTRLDFHDDPFRDYRYEDPFDITFDDFDDGSNNNNNNNQHHEKIIITRTSSSNSKKDPFGSDAEDNSQRITKEDSNNDFDPFNLITTGRQSVPLLSLSNNNNNVNDPFSLNNGRSSVPLFNNNNNNNNNNDNGKRLPSEDEQLMWANRESLRLEEERKLNEIKEKADLQLAITLSKNHK